jgi:uncharacterized protein with HEPN domain
MQPDIIRQSLLDIVESIDSIEGYLSEFMGDRRDFNVFMQKKHLRRSVERELEIIGEAVNRILRADPSFEIDNARKIIATRNYVAHGYDKIDHETIWYIVTKQLSKLRAEVRQLLG